LLAKHPDSSYERAFGFECGAVQVRPARSNVLRRFTADFACWRGSLTPATRLLLEYYMRN